MQIEEALATFLLQLEADGRSPHTVGQYRRHVGAFAAWWGEGDIREITEADVARFLIDPETKERRGGGERRASTMNALRSSLRSFFAWLAKAGLVERNAARLVRRARCGPPPPKGLSGADQQKLLVTLEREDGGRDHMLFALMLATGIRIGSALALEAADVDLERGELLLRRTKGDRPETLPLGRPIRDHLRRYLDGRGAGPLFTGPSGRPLTGRHVHRRLRHWLERAGVDRAASPHALRHSFAIGLYERSADILLVKEALRHRALSSTLRYARVSEGRLRAALGA